MKAKNRAIEEAVKKACFASPFYSETSWIHSHNTAKMARRFARTDGGNPEIAYLGGLLHDLGSIRYGRENHHWTGARDAVVS